MREYAAANVLIDGRGMLPVVGCSSNATVFVTRKPRENEVSKAVLGRGTSSSPSERAIMPLETVWHARSNDRQLLVRAVNQVAARASSDHLYNRARERRERPCIQKLVTARWGAIQNA